MRPWTPQLFRNVTQGERACVNTSLEGVKTRAAGNHFVCDNDARIRLSLGIPSNHASDSSEARLLMRKSIFHEDWWLDALAPGRWREMTCYRGGQIAAYSTICRTP